MPTMFYIGSTLKVASLTSEKAKKTYAIFGKLFGIVFGGIMGMFIVMVGTLIATVISIFFDGPNFLQITSSNTVLFCSYVCISAVVGCITGYYIGKKITQTRL